MTRSLPRMIRTLTGMAVLLGIGSIGLVLNLRRTRTGLMAGLPADARAARVAFETRIRAFAAPGMSVDRLTRHLAREGFRVDPARACATRIDRIGAARRVWRISWEASGRRLAAIRPSMGVSAF